MTGLTSVTFRGLSPEKIVSLAVQAGLDGIEWGGDIHVPPGERQTAVYVKELTQKAGKQIISYGSYYRLGQQSSFEPVLQTAVWLGAPNIRIWAGQRSPEQSDDAWYCCLAKEAAQVAQQSAEYGISVSLEYHRGTLTQTLPSALKLLELAGSDNLFCYWQPNPELTMEQNQQELCGIIPYLKHVHVFHWKGENQRYPLAEGESDWKKYLDCLRQRWDADNQALILEFVKDDMQQQYLEDAQQLKQWIGGKL